jgi:translocation and assembly module TamB
MRKKLFYSFLVLLLLILLSLGWLLGTQSGLNAAVGLAERFVPALQINQAQGRLLGNMSMQGIHYLPEDSSGAEIEQFSLDWQPTALFKATLSIDALNISGVDIHTVAGEETAEDSEHSLPEVQLPLRIQIASFSVNDVDLINENGDEISLIRQFQTTAALNYDELIINELTLNRDDLEARLNGKVALQSPYLATLDYQVTLKQLFEAPLQVDGHVNGNIDKLTLKQTVSAPLESQQTVVVTDAMNELQWSLEASAEQINLAALLPEQPTRFESLKINAEGGLSSLNASLKGQVIQPELPPLNMEADIDSDNLENWQMTLNTAINEAQTLHLAGTVDISGESPAADLTAAWQNLGWPLTGEEKFVSSPEGKLSITGTLENYQAQLQSSLIWQQQPLQLSASTAGNLEQLQIKSLQLQGFEGSMNATGMLNWQATPLQYQLNANWDNMVLPESLAQRVVKLEQGRIELEGNPEALQLSTQVDVIIDDVSARIEAEGSGETSRGFDNAKLNIQLADGSLHYQGPLLWQGDTLVDGKLVLNELNPGVLVLAWPGSLSGQTDIKLTSQQEVIKVSAQDIAINGQLRDRPVKLNGSVSYSDQLVDVSDLQLQSGQSSLAADGQLQDRNIDFNWSLQSPDLNDFYPGVSGRLDAEGKVSGTIEKPAIDATLKGSDVAYQQFQAGTVNGDASVTLSDNADLNVDIAVQNLILPQLNADSLNFKVQGKQNQHDIELTLESAPLDLSLLARGGLQQDQVWQGQLQELAVSNDKAGQWQLTEKGSITLSSNAQSIPQHCWTSSSGQFCIEASHSNQQWQASGNFAEVPLSLFEAFVVQLEQLKGSLRGQFSLASDEQSVITGEGEIFLDDASLQLNQTALNQQKPVPLNNVRLRYQIDADSSTASFHLEPQLDGVSAVDAELETAGLDTLINKPEQASLDGNITTAVRDLSQLELSHPAFSDVKGQLDINLDIGGTVAQPRIEGTASLQQGQIAIVDAGILLKQIEARVDGNLDAVNFDFQAHSGEGSLNGDGVFKLTQSSWELTTNIKGQQFEAMNTPEALVIAEPDLTISVTPEKTLVKGKVHIPRAQIEPTQFNSSVSPSRDVVVVTEEEKVTESGAVTEIDITVSLGDKVKLKAMGFQGRLTGSLRVFGKTSDILLANGEILVKDGSYVAYGQTLHVDDGAIRFAGGPIDNPELDIKAVRKGDTYRVGLHIQGTAASPQADLFSDPSMGQDDILSYLLLGKPLNQASATDAAILASAATGMGLQNGAMIGDQIASTFGLDEFSIEGDSAENAALQVGKYLSPKLYLSYGIGVFESVSTVELRYQLSKIWALKAESGTESGIDLLYTYERGGPDE